MQENKHVFILGTSNEHTNPTCDPFLKNGSHARLACSVEVPRKKSIQLTFLEKASHVQLHRVKFHNVHVKLINKKTYQKKINNTAWSAGQCLHPSK